MPFWWSLQSTGHSCSRHLYIERPETTAVRYQVPPGFVTPLADLFVVLLLWELRPIKSSSLPPPIGRSPVFRRSSIRSSPIHSDLSSAYSPSMSWLRSAVHKAVEVSGKNNLTRTVRNYAGTVVHHAGQAVAGGTRIIQNRIVTLSPFQTPSFIFCARTDGIFLDCIMIYHHQYFFDYIM